MRVDINGLIINRSDEGWPYWFRIKCNEQSINIHHDNIPYLINTLQNMYDIVQPKIEAMRRRDA